MAYQYDDIGRLSQAVGPYGLINYTYDRVGNRLSRYTTLGGGRYEIYHYASGTNRIDEVTGDAPRGFAFDDRGNMTFYDGRSLTYNADNRLTGVTEEGVTISTHTYNGFGQRISKTVETAGGSETTVFLYKKEGSHLHIDKLFMLRLR